MLLRKPKNHTIVDMYKGWCASVLKSNKNYFDEHDTQVRWKGIRRVYERTIVATAIVSEQTTGEANGKNRAFQTINKNWEPATVKVYKNGVLLTNNLKNGNRDYYLVPGKHTIIMLNAPEYGDLITTDYKFYNHTLIMSYMMFRYIIETYNKYAADALIEGHRFSLGSRLGYLFPARIERYFTHPKIDVVSTIHARKKEKGHPAIYFTTPDYCMIKWCKYYDNDNDSFYIFVTSKTKMRKDFSKSNRDNPFLKNNYKFYPVEEKTYQSKSA